MIEELRNEMSQFLKDMEKNIKDPKELNYMLKRTEKLFDVIFKELHKIADYKEDKFNEIEERQKEHETQLDLMSEKISQLFQDIYDEEIDEFEIVCPYCNFKFVADIDETKTEIVCPECNNTIELDWN